MPIAIFGDKDVGKATFMVLTYATQISYSAQSQADFRFWVDPTKLQVIAKEYSAMKMGGWPTDILLREDLEFIFGYGMKGGVFGKLFKSKKKYSNLKFRLYDVSKGEYSAAKTKDSISSMEMSEEMDDICRSRIWVILLDHTQKDTDKEMAALISNLTLFAREPVYPVVFFTKFDRAKQKLDKKEKKKGSTESTHSSESKDSKKKGEKTRKLEVPDQKDRGRSEFEIATIKRFFPKTLTMLQKIERLNKPKVFFSSVKTSKESASSKTRHSSESRDSDKKGERVPELKMGANGYDLDYSYDEYVAFIKYIGKVGHEMGWDDES